MSTRTENPTARPPVEGVHGARILIVESRYYPEIADALISGADAEIKKNGATYERVVVPGAFEIPGAIALAADRYDGFLALGCVIRGETPHFDYVCAEAARGITDAAAATGVPVAFGVVTANTLEQAEARSGGAHGNKGNEAADAAVEMAELMRTLPRRR